MILSGLSMAIETDSWNVRFDGPGKIMLQNGGVFEAEWKAGIAIDVKRLFFNSFTEARRMIFDRQL